MEAFPALDVAIGLAFVYLLLAMVCTAVNEWIASVFRLRARTLKGAIRRMLDSPEHKGGSDRLTDVVFKQPLIRSLTDWRGQPAYIPAKRFVAALNATLDSPGAAKPDNELLGHDLKYVRDQIDAVNKHALDSAAPLEDWFNDSMDRASGWYKRRLQWITVAVAAAVTILANADTISAARILWQNPTVRAAVVAQAQERAKKPAPSGKRAVDTAPYPDENLPTSDTGGGSTIKPIPPAPVKTPDSTDTQNAAQAGARVSEADDENEAEEAETPASAAGITDDEQAALAQLIGWSRDFKAANKEICEQRQEEIEKGQGEIDKATADRRCVQGGTGLVPTEEFSGGGLVQASFIHLTGWFITMVAVSLGAPFWFDVLQKFINIRSSNKPEEAKDAKESGKKSVKSAKKTEADS